jgi:hypothetical protein
MRVELLLSETKTFVRCLDRVVGAKHERNGGWRRRGSNSDAIIE